jgi:hypothetical protein
MLPPNPSLASFLNSSLWLTLSNTLEKSVYIAILHAVAGLSMLIFSLA